MRSTRRGLGDRASIDDELLEHARSACDCGCVVLAQVPGVPLVSADRDLSASFADRRVEIEEFGG